MEWRNDPIEKARRIGIWWENHNTIFQYLNTAFRLISLVQTSSCFVEQAFSQMGTIVKTCGSRMLEDMIELRIYRRMNNEILNELGIE